MVYLKIFDSNLLKLDKESYKNTGICYNGYITIKKPMIMRVLIVYVLRTWLFIVDALKKKCQ